jgi:Reverse transcriptase (RNA-dependent DNA polymerase)
MGTEPASIDEALRGLNAKEWQAALDYEISQLKKLSTWVLVDLPKGEPVIPCTKVLKEKCGPPGKVETYSVRIVAGGHKQVEGINYTETFSAAVKIPSVHVVLANAAERDWEIHQIDVKSAYLQALLKETIYMRLPCGVLKPGQEGKVCRLLKGLYGLKQAGRGWYQKLTKVMVGKLGFKWSALDHSVFCRKCNEEHTVVAVATDDMALTSKWKSDITKLKSEISQHWEITDGGEMQWYLGFAIKRDRVAQTISINQQAYINVEQIPTYQCKAREHANGSRGPIYKGPGTLDAYTSNLNVWCAIYRGNWMCAMAGYDNTARLCICGVLFLLLVLCTHPGSLLLL